MSEYDEAVSYDDREEKPTPVCAHKLPRDICGACGQKNMKIEPAVHRKSKFVPSNQMPKSPAKTYAVDSPVI
jgi:hypothetical protein